MERLIEERNKLYRKSGETRLTEVAGFYAAQARDLNRKVQELQMECFLQNNGEMRGNQIDLNGLQTDEAVRQLGLFLAVKETAEGGGKGSVTVVTGWWARSVGGRGRVRPSVMNWLEQKGYSYHMVNHGCFRVYLGDKNSKYKYTDVGVNIDKC